MVIFAAVLIGNAFLSYSYSIGPNYRNVSTDTFVNITNSLPEVLTVTITDPITLNAGTTLNITCNATVRDYNGGDTIVNVTATFYDNNSVGPTSPDDNNDHYTNLNCTNVSVNGFYANFSCNFTIWYYANNGSNWVCNVTATDSYVFNASVGSQGWNDNSTTINALLALNVTRLIDYGDMSVGDTSGPEEANITNFGNTDINVSVKGYGAAENDGLSFDCDVGNISVDSQRYSLNQTGDFTTQYTQLQSSFNMIQNLTLVQETVDGTQIQNSTYWRLYVPPNPFGECNGTVVFQAELAS